MLRRLTVTIFRARRACSETTNDALRAMSRLHTGPHHLSKQVHIVISLTRHLFANRVQNFEKSWSTIHACWLFLGLCTLFFVDDINQVQRPKYKDQNSI